MYYKPENGQRFTDHSNIRSTSGIMFTEIIEDSELAARGIFPLQPTKPVVAANEIATEGVPELVEGVYKQTWIVTEATPEQLAEKAAKFEELKATKNAEINQWRDVANATTFPHKGKHVAVDALSMRDLIITTGYIALFGAFPPDWPGGWKYTDNSVEPMPSIEDFKAMFTSMASKGTNNFNHAQALKAQLAAATTEEDVAAITW